jgi:alkanesulfonate monooxygenase SsuD/methylene tetrahydromethanopterin reductase-like flavin-dependent oxidoreductase (luciferase family)
MRVKYGVVLPSGDARTAAELAQEAEAAGWDGFFVYDVVWGMDPWVMLATVAMNTERVRIGTMLTPVSRRRPWKLAGETVTLDHLSNGRLILSVGLGATDTGFEEFGEETDRKIRAELLDEGLDILTGLWRGQPFNYSGKHYHVRESNFMPPPPPVQSPRIPIWVVGLWPRPKSMRRVLRYDGLLPTMQNADGTFAEPTPDDIREMRAFVEERRAEPTPFDIVVEGETPGGDPARAGEIVQPLAEAGATWWLETKWLPPNEPADVRVRLRRGPPRVE